MRISSTKLNEDGSQLWGEIYAPNGIIAAAAVSQLAKHLQVPELRLEVQPGRRYKKCEQKGFINFCANRRIPDAEGQQSPGECPGRVASRISDEQRGMCQHGIGHHEGPLKALHVTGCERLVLDVATVDAPAKVTARIRLVGHCQG